MEGRAATAGPGASRRWSEASALRTPCPGACPASGSKRAIGRPETALVLASIVSLAVGVARRAHALP